MYVSGSSLLVYAFNGDVSNVSSCWWSNHDKQGFLQHGGSEKEELWKYLLFCKKRFLRPVVEGENERRGGGWGEPQSVCPHNHLIPSVITGFSSYFVPQGGRPEGAKRLALMLETTSLNKLSCTRDDVVIWANQRGLSYFTGLFRTTFRT